MLNPEVFFGENLVLNSEVLPTDLDLVQGYIDI